MPATKKEIDNFLESYRKAVTKRGVIVFIERADINKTLASLGITESQATQEVKTLKPEHYQAGPQSDRDSTTLKNETGDFWIFEKTVAGKVAYIKLKLAKSVHNAAIVIPKCWMHESVANSPSQPKTKAVVKKKKSGAKR